MKRLSGLWGCDMIDINGLNPFVNPVSLGLVSSDDWRALPMPYKASRWKKGIVAVVLSQFDTERGIPLRIHIHPSDCFKALTLGMAYEVVAVVMEEETGRKFETFAKWVRDGQTNAYAVVSLYGDVYGIQGGYHKELLPNTYFSEAEQRWMMLTSGQVEDSGYSYFIAY